MRTRTNSSRDSSRVTVRHRHAWKTDAFGSVRCGRDVGDPAAARTHSSVGQRMPQQRQHAACFRSRLRTVSSQIYSEHP